MSPIQSFRFFLLSDGGSDRSLFPILRWKLRQNGCRGPIQEQFADLRDLPPLRQLESIAVPKALLHELLRTAGELSGRRRKKFRVEPAAFPVSQFIEDFGPLRELSAFSAFEKETREVLYNHFREFLVQ
ncbi:MAG: hypothetical protein ACLFRG_18060 [Desulfococcaceae bacterium]